MRRKVLSPREAENKTLLYLSGLPEEPWWLRLGRMSPGCAQSQHRDVHLGPVYSCFPDLLIIANVLRAAAPLSSLFQYFIIP